jgi:hypothetical protein
MKSRARYLGVGCLILLTGCGNKEDANEKHFGAAISRFVEQSNDLCMGFRVNQWPIDLLVEWPADGRPNGPQQMAALEGVGLVSSTITDAAQNGVFGRAGGVVRKVKRYELTSKGRRFYREKAGAQGTMSEGNFCYGKAALGSIVRWEGPVKGGEPQQARVTYTYKINDLAEWTKDAAFEAVFQKVAGVVEGAGKRELQKTLILTSTGWEASGAN